jgi:hypothetical protein
MDEETSKTVETMIERGIIDVTSSMWHLLQPFQVNTTNF